MHIDLNGVPVPVGRLWMRARGKSETASFAYDPSWLGNPERFALEPSLALAPDTHHTRPEATIFGAVGDSAPDRWGRTLMRRIERQRAEEEGRTPRTLFEADYILLVYDEARQGALRFRGGDGGPFLAPKEDAPNIPPVLELPHLLGAADRVSRNEERDEDLRMLIPSAPLGGARPKASVRDSDEHLLLAKFPHDQDDTSIVLWEGVALSLAKKAGIDVPDWRIEDVAGRSVILIRRFDRTNGHRIPFLSAMSMLEAGDGDERSYLEIADALRQHGSATRADLAQLWRRVVFNILISNTDDHLRNHGFLHDGPNGWRLSPAYDLNPVPLERNPRILSTWIDLDGPSCSIDVALETAEYYGLDNQEAKKVAIEVAGAVVDWHRVASTMGIAKSEIDGMASAFEHDDIEKARGLRP